MKITDHLIAGVPRKDSPNKGGFIKPSAIVMHYTAGYDAGSAINTLISPKSKVSAHVVLDRDGGITQLVPFNIKAWHAGPSRLGGKSNVNDFSIGIEIVNIGWMRLGANGRYIDPYGRLVPEGSEWTRDPIAAKHPRVGSETYYWPRYTDAQLEALDAIVEALIETYPSIQDVVSHEEIDTRGWKTDPGPAFPMARYRRHFNVRDDRVELVVTTPAILNVRETPSPNSQQIAQFKQGTKVAVLAREGKWLFVSRPENHGMPNGWVYGDYVTRV